MPKTFRLTIEFTYADDENITLLGAQIEDAVFQLVDPGCDGELPCPREWSILRETLDE